MHLLRLTIHVDAFGLAQGGAYDWHTAGGAKLLTHVLTLAELADWPVDEAAAHLARLAMDRGDRQLRLF